MKRAAVVALVLALAGCGDATGPEVADLAGDWIATEGTVTNLADPTEQLDLIALGLEFRMSIAPDGAVQASITTPGEGTEMETGSITLEDGDDMTLLLGGDRLGGRWSLVDGRFSMNLDTGMVWDFEGDGTDIPARLAMVLERS